MRIVIWHPSEQREGDTIQHLDHLPRVGDHIHVPGQFSDDNFYVTAVKHDYSADKIFLYVRRVKGIGK